MGGEQARAREVHDLVQWAVTERSRAICRGWSRVRAEHVQHHMGTLQRWLQHYRVPTTETQRRLLHEMWHHVRAVMPGNAAGRKRLERLEQLLRQA